VTNIGVEAFFGCNGLTGLNLNNNGYLDYGAFHRCEGLSGTLTISSNITDIGMFAFAGCFRLTSVSTYGGGSIGACAFMDCSSLSSLTFGSLTAPTVGTNAFLRVADVGTLYHPEGGTGYTSLFYTHLPAGWTTSITTGLSVDATFQDAQGITYVVTKATAPYEVQVLGGICNPNRGLYVHNPVIPATVTDGVNTFAVVGIQDLAFAGPSDIEEFPCSFVSNLTGTLIIECSGGIGNAAFRNCEGLMGTLIIPSTVTDIGVTAFTRCGFSGALTIPASVKNIGFAAFSECWGLTELTLNNSGIIDEFAFTSCTRLTSVDLSAYTGDNIGIVAFNYCRSLSSLTFGSPTPPTVGLNAFREVASVGTLYYPEGGTGYDVLLSTHLPAGWVAKVTGNVTVSLSDALSIRATANGLQVSGLIPGESLILYNIQGSLIYNYKANTNEQFLPLREHGIYIVIAGARSAKAVF
jgi:hypothetical protein